ncbi:hypothetical protein G6F57_018162 [Rhizopus arrhizus]|nr:hypothetical protein G6F65_013854 [Rhizopus arrhizus]KAG1443234.1 hypothetical protein G6F57_018162 [Rhizopus arrhizus]
MKYFSLVWAQLFRSRTRTLLTLLSVVAAFLLFGMLDSVRVAFNSGGSVEGANRLVVASRLSITQSLPIRLETQIRQVAGVRPEELLPELLGVAQLLRRVPRTADRPGAAGRLEADPHRRHRRRNPGQAVRLEDR